MCGVIRRDRVRNKVNRRCKLQRNLTERGKAAVVWWLGHIERMKRERLVKKIYRADVGTSGLPLKYFSELVQIGSK